MEDGPSVESSAATATASSAEQASRLRLVRFGVVVKGETVLAGGGGSRRAVEVIS